MNANPYRLNDDDGDPYTTRKTGDLADILWDVIPMLAGAAFIAWALWGSGWPLTRTEHVAGVATLGLLVAVAAVDVVATLSARRNVREVTDR